tara:strand:- start:390 stop:713 length:324 start_codon:yes stop_codon:yes gene_type:complete
MTIQLIKEKKMKDIETKDYQLWKEYVEETQARELGFFNELDVAMEFFTHLTEVPAKFNIDEDWSKEVIRIVNEVTETDKYSSHYQTDGYVVIAYEVPYRDLNRRENE